jgi:hypothetical protein
MPGTGKKKTLHDHLRKIAELRGFPFSIKMKSLEPRGEGSSENAEADGEAAGPESGTQFSYEYSLVHMGYDIARMSMQDKHILRPIFLKLGQGSQVMAGKQGRGSRIIVLYHAHLLSTESLLLIQACLENNHNDLSVWMTSEMPVPLRIRDWFVEIPVASTWPSPEISWSVVFTKLINKWQNAGQPILQDIKQVKSFVYEMLMRNLRWVECVHFLLDVILLHPCITEDQRRRAITVLAGCEATSGGYTIPSYRIPILWESLFIELRSIFSGYSSDGSAARPTRVVRPRKKGVGSTVPRLEGLPTT